MIKTEAVREAGAVVFRDDGKFLALVTGGKSWSIPKGHIKKGELPAQTAIRETEEETSVSSVTHSFVLRFYFTKDNSKYELLVYAATYLSGEANYSEHIDTKALWLSIDDAKRILSIDGNYLKAVQIVYKNLIGKKKESAFPDQDDIECLTSFVPHNGLSRLSNEQAKRPLFCLKDRNKTARLLESSHKAKSIAELIALADVYNIPCVQNVGRWLITDFIQGNSLSFSETVSPKMMRYLGEILGQLRNVQLPSHLVEHAIIDIPLYLQRKLTDSLFALTKSGLISKADSNIIDKECGKWVGNCATNNNIVITHWDFVPGNILVKNDGLLLLLDFESCRLFIDGYDVFKAKQHFLTSPAGWEAFELGYLKHTNCNEVFHPSIPFRLFFFCRVFANRIYQPWLDHRIVAKKIDKLLKEADK